MRLIKHDGKVRVKKHRDENGRATGVTVEHKDGRVDAVARPETYRHGVRMDRD